MSGIYVIGIGPGNIDYLTPAGAKKIEDADIVVGAARCIDAVAGDGKETFVVTDNFSEMVEFIKRNHERKEIAVLVTGDSGFYSMLRLLKRHFSSSELRVIPGISSVQYMFSRLCMMWDDARIASLHGKNMDYIKEVRACNKVALLTDKKWTPQKIALEMMNSGIDDRTIYVGENLSYFNENIVGKSVPDLAREDKKYGICVVVIINEQQMEI